MALAALVGGCGLPTSSAEPGSRTIEADGRPLVLTTMTVLADMARQVGGDHVEVVSIIPPGVEVHGYEPTPGDLRRGAQADLVLDNGLGLEGWFEQFVARVEAPHVVVGAEVEPIPITRGEYRGAANPHAWMSPVEGARYVDRIETALAELAPEHAAEFATRATAYRAQIEQVGRGLIDALDRLDDEHRVLVTCEGAFSYLARDAGLEEAYLWAVNAEQQGTAHQLAAVVDLVRDREVPAVFCESTVSGDVMQAVVAATGARFGGVLYVDSLSEPDGPVPTYLDLLRYDVATIVQGLTGDTAEPGAGR
ncbi:MAG TPA: metal ABC transporter substrate-binding protein [Actinotalea sp.]|nr:metal ABC transporter substrate-binding protein [Actinotalea sp.]